MRTKIQSNTVVSQARAQGFESHLFIGSNILLVTRQCSDRGHCDVIMFVMSQHCVCDITVCCTSVCVMASLNKHNTIDVQHFISKMKGAVSSERLIRG